MKQNILICLGVLVTIAVFGQGKSGELPHARLTVRVLDEQSTPVQGATVRIGFSGKSYDQELLQIGTTDTTGEYSSEGYSSTRLSADVRKDGFYSSGTPFIDFTNVEAGRWQPWNPTAQVVLRPIGKPIALYAKKVQLQLPALDEPCGFDLEASDWVTPHGKGMKKDFIFTIHEKWNGIYDFDLQGELTFKNPLDGLQEAPIPDVGKNSVFKWERLAPENGYNPKQELRDAWFPDGSGQKPIRSFKDNDKAWEGYVFRVRTVEQDGGIVSAHYGKIRGGIQVYPDSKTGKPNIVFTYYFNPTPNDLDLEWDTTKNLFGDLPFMETPREP